MNWDGNKVNDFFIKEMNRFNPNKYDNKGNNPFFIALRIVDQAMSDLMFECGCYAWKRETLLSLLDRFANAEIPKGIELNYNFPISQRDIMSTTKCFETQQNAAKRIIESINNETAEFL